MNETLVSDPSTLHAEIARLNKMVKALMSRAERAMSAQGSEFGLFQATVMLETQVRERTHALEAALAENEEITLALQNAQSQMRVEIEQRKQVNAALEQEKEEQRVLIQKLEEAHNQLLQSEKLASIGQLAAGVAHEINNPIGFVNSNLGTLKGYVTKLLELIEAYEYINAEAELDAKKKSFLEQVRQRIDFEFMRSDINTLIDESIDGTSRVRRIVQDLRDFSRIGSQEWLGVNLHEGLNSTLNVLGNELKHKAVVRREYGEQPLVECIPSQINQVFMNILINAAQAIADRGLITIRSGCRDNDEAWISIADNGGGISPENLSKIFDPFFTTKPLGKGTGLGLSVSYGIIKNHRGRIEVQSQVGQGTTFTIFLPVHHVVDAAPATPDVLLE